jgi:uncharacterized protein
MTERRTAALMVARPVPPVVDRRAALRPVAITLAALLLGGLLNAESLARTAESQPAGWRHSLAVGATDPLLALSSALHMTTPRAVLDGLLDRTSAEPVPPPAPDPTVEPSAPPAPTTPAPTTPPTASPTPDTPTPDPLLATPQDPATLFVTGDSLTEALGPALANAALRTGVLQPAHQVKYSAGLTRPDFYDWPAALGHHLQASPTDIVVFMIGANDAQAIRIDGQWVAYGEDGWADEYRRRVEQTAEILADGARTVYWLGQPIPRSASFRAKMALLNGIYEQVAAVHPNVTYVSTWELFSTPEGDYSDYLLDDQGRPQLVRRTDGIHLTPTGGTWLAAHVLDMIQQDWTLVTPP